MTARTRIVNGIPCLIPNRTDEVETGSPHWYISYNNHDHASYGCDTTALVLGQGEYFLILKGDHRSEFQEIVSTHKLMEGTRLRRCLKYVAEHRDQLHEFSDPVI